MTTEVKNVECLCAFVQALGQGVAATLSTFIGSVIGLLELAKVEILLVSNLENLEDLGRKLASEQALAVLEQGVQPVSAVFAMINAYTAPFADCDPVSSFASVLKAAQDVVLSEFDDLSFEIQQWGAAITDRQNEIERLDRLIDILTQIQSAIDECGDV